jgi:hypothetical protein
MVGRGATAAAAAVGGGAAAAAKAVFRAVMMTMGSVFHVTGLAVSAQVQTVEGGELVVTTLAFLALPFSAAVAAATLPDATQLPAVADPPLGAMM